MRMCYTDRRFSAASETIIEQANSIIAEYDEQGFTLTLRQLYYQFVSRDIIANNLQSYKRLGSVINDARLAGRVSWTAIEDRTRNLRALPHWDSPQQIMDSVIYQYRTDKWASQMFRPEVWIEKDALVGVISGVCEDLDVPYFACRGYNSQSEQWAAGQRFRGYMDRGQTPVVLHLGDHDPSGIDMTRDNLHRLGLFAEDTVEIERLALNFDQVSAYNPPPNPAKTTDSRYAGYIKQYGTESWELDALNPRAIADLVKTAILARRDDQAWEEACNAEEESRAALVNARDNM